MPGIELIVVLALFASATLSVLAIVTFARDLVAQPALEIDAELSIDPRDEQEAIELALAPPPTGRIDQFFFRMIEESGTRFTMSGAMTLIIGSAVIGAAVPLVIFDNLLAAAAGVLVGALAPLVWWSFCRVRRLKKMRKHLPETLDIIADAVRGGRNLEQAAEMAAHETPGPLGLEFGSAHKQLVLGHAPTAVLDRMVRRIPLPEFRIFATAVLVHRRAGGNLAQLTERLARAARDRQEFYGHLNAVTASSKLSAIGLVGASALAFAALASLQPNYIKMFVTHPWGPALLITAATLQIIGIVWVYRILRVNF